MTHASVADGEPVAQLLRSGFVESVHHGHVVAVGPDGAVLWQYGAPEAPTFPRSANKPLQAVGMVRAGLDLGAELLALASASHSGEQFHLDGALRILHGAGLVEADLQNTPDLPYGAEERVNWVVAGRGPHALAQNCSGKHAAMLATCVVNGWDTASYRDVGHRLQQGTREAIEALAGEPVSAVGVDGCGAPVMAISLTGLARAFGALATAGPGTAERKVADAIRAFPLWLGGTGRDVTRLIGAIPGLVAKDGAEAVYAAGLADGRAVALKISDGGQRARPVVMAAALKRLGLDDPLLEELAHEPVLGHGERVGEIHALIG